MNLWSQTKNRISKTLATTLIVALFASVMGFANPAQAAYAPPVIATVSPNSGSITGGDLITVTGSNLQYVTGGALGQDIRVEFLNRAQDGSWLTFQAPEGLAAGKVDLSLYGQINVTEPAIYTYTPTSITSVTPGVGTFLGGTAITINGSGFGPLAWGDGSLVVKVGNGFATNVKRVSPTQITAVTPPNAIGTVDVQVSFSNWTTNNVNPNLSVKWSNNVITGTGLFKYGSDPVTPSIASISPDKGSIAGGQDVTITGKYLRGTDLNNGVFTFDGIPATVKSVNLAGTSAVVTTPAHAAGQVNVAVTTIDGAASLGAGYQYGPPPTISSVTANGGVTDGGTKVTISGSNFGTAGAPIVKIGGKLALCVKLVNASTITAVTRENTAGAADVEVTATTGAGSTKLTGGYTYRAATSSPNITSISPDRGPVSGNTSVTLTTDGAFPSDVPNVMFGSVCALSVTRVNAQTIVAVAPANPEGIKNLSVTWANAYTFKSQAYTYFTPTPPEVSSVSPSIDWSVGGKLITITGRGFGILPPLVKFGTVTATTITSYSDTQIQVVAPANTVGAKEISVTPSGSSTAITRSSAFTYKAPVITTISPNNGLVAGGTAVTINGDGFGDSGTPAVTFGGKPATNIVRVSATQLTAVTPSGTKGFTKVIVTPNGGGSITSDTAYAYTTQLVTPLITDSSPWSGPAAGGITVTLTGRNFVGTDGKKGVLKINGSVPANVVINSAGTQATFTAPALSPGYYYIEVVTNEGRAWRQLYRVFPGPSAACSNVGYDSYLPGGPFNVEPTGGTVLRVYGSDLWHTYDADGSYPPTVKVDGLDAEVTVVSGYQYFGPYDTRRYIAFKDPTTPNPANSYGQKTITISAGNAGTVTISGCINRVIGNASITADDKAITYGDPTPDFTFTAAGERDGDKVVTSQYMFTGKSPTIYGPSTTPPTASGVYSIRPYGETMNPSANLSHYNFNHINGTYTISGKPQGIEATCSGDKIYDGDRLTYTLTGIPAGEVTKSVTILWSGADANGNVYSSSTAPKNAGTYSVVASYLTFNSGSEVSYSFTYTSTTCKISKRTVEIVALNQEKTYGDSDPALPWEFYDPANTNLVDGESITGSLSRLDAGKDEGEPVGSYLINKGNLDINNVNYNIEYVIPETSEAHPGEYGYLIINPKTITVTAANKTKMYGNNDPDLTYTTSPSTLPNGEDIFFDGSLTRDEGQDVGDYTINQGTLDSDNYTITFVSGTFSITPRPIRVRFDAQEKVYGENDPTFTRYNEIRYNSGDLGLVYGDTLETVLTGTATRATGENVGTYQISKGTLAPNANYTITWINADLKINKRPVKLIADSNQTKVYGDNNPAAYTYTVETGVELEGFVNGDSITGGSASRQTGENVGEYDITVGTLAASSNYELSFKDGVFTITKRPITVSPNALTKVYGANDPTLTYSITTGSLAFTDTLNGSLDREEGEDVGFYDYVLGGFGDGSPNSNYDITVNNTNQFEITPRDITIVASDDSKTYGDSDPTFDYTVTPSSLPNNSPINLTGVLSRVTGNDVGEYDINQGTLGVSDTNFNVTSFTAGTFTINKLSIDVYADDKSVTYGEPLPSNSIFTYDELPYGDELDSATYAYSTTPPVNAGDYDITPSAATFTPSSVSGNYTVTYHDGTLTINKRKVYITVTNAEKVYGEDDPEFSYTADTGVTGEGLIDSDSVDGQPGRDSGENVGDYDLTPGTLDAGTNYEVFINTGSLKIKPFPVVLTPTASQQKTYGDFDPTLTYDLDSTLPNSESFSSVLERASGETVGTYAYDITSLQDNNLNYTITLAAGAGTFEIVKKNITVTADAKSKTYGDLDPELTYTTSPASLENGEPIDISGAITRDEGENAGDYDITQGALVGSSNITIQTFTDGTFTIDPKDLHITADNQEATYGDNALPSNSYTADAADTLVGSDAISTASYSYSTAVPFNAGTYNITPSALVFTNGLASNYNVIYQNGTLTINPRQLEVTADPASKTYGDADPTFTYELTSGEFVEGDDFTGALGRGTDENVGFWDLTVGTLTAGSNYEISFVKDQLEIKKFKVKVQPSANQKKTYGDNDPTLTFGTNVVLPNGESLSGNLGRSKGENVDDYDFNLGDLESVNPNYEITLDPANTNQFTIEKRDITVTIENLEKFYGEADPEWSFTYSPSSLTNGEVITITGEPSRATGENVGDYAISKNTLDGGSNFNVTIAAGSPKLTIKKKVIKIEAGDQTMVYGSTLPANTFSLVSGYTMVGSETVSSVGYDYSSTPVHVAEYDITPKNAAVSGGLASNYDFEYVDGTLTITKAPLTITLGNASIFWGEAAPNFKATATGLIGSDEIGDISYIYDGSSTEPTDVGTYELSGDALLNMQSGEVGDYEIEWVPGSYVINPPFAVNFSPARGPIAGGTFFTITGLGFGFDNPTVLFDGLEATGVNLVDSGTITGYTPEHPEGLVEVILITSYGELNLGKVFTYFPPPPAPKINSLGPVQGPTAGNTEITLDGSAFIGSDGKVGKIYVDGVLIKNPKFSRDGKTLIIKTTEHPAGKVDIKVETKDGSFTYKEAFEFIPGLRSLKVLVIFGGDSSWLQPAARKQLDALANRIRGKVSLAINSNGWVNRTNRTDKDEKLSADRANRVVNYLKKRGVDAVFTINGKGIYQSGNQKLNRRAELDISYIE